MSTATATTSKQWTSSAGPRQTKQVNDAIQGLIGMGRRHKEITDYGEHVYHSPFQPVNPAVAAKVAELGEKYDWTVTRGNYQAIIADAVAMAQAVEVPTVDKRSTPEERERLRAEREQAERERAEKAAAHKIEYDRELAGLRERYPWAIQDDGKMSRHARAAKNIKEELRREFPGIAFSVTSESYSGGNSVSVKWRLGPTEKAVEAIVNKYKDGHFDGMTDYYEHDHSPSGDACRHWFGSTKYLHVDRDVDAEIELLSRNLCELQGVEYQGPSTRRVFGEMDDLDVHAHVRGYLRKCNLPAGAVVVGLKHSPPWGQWESEGNDPQDHEPYMIDFTVPEKPATAATDGAGATIGEGYRIEKHRHTKRDFDFWLVVLNDRVDRDRFDELAAKAKQMGGWYSRQWGKTPGGFGFADEMEAKAFAATL